MYCIAAEVTEAVGGDAFCNLASAVVIAILTSSPIAWPFSQTLHITINGIFELGVRERRSSECGLFQQQTLCILGTQLHLFPLKSAHAKFLPLLAKLWALFGFPGPSFWVLRWRACARHWQSEDVCVREIRLVQKQLGEDNNMSNRNCFVYDFECNDVDL